MAARQQKTTMANRNSEPVKWFEIDATGMTLGRLSSEIAKILRGKHKPTFTPHADTGDGVVVKNAKGVKVTGNKEATKLYRRYTGFQSGLRETGYREMMEKKPEYIIEHAVKGMMPKTRLGRAQLKRLRILAGEQHRLQAQQPIAVNV